MPVSYKHQKFNITISQKLIINQKTSPEKHLSRTPHHLLNIAHIGDLATEGRRRKRDPGQRRRCTPAALVDLPLPRALPYTILNQCLQTRLTNPEAESICRVERIGIMEALNSTRDFEVLSCTPCHWLLFQTRNGVVVNQGPLLPQLQVELQKRNPRAVHHRDSHKTHVHTHARSQRRDAGATVRPVGASWRL